LVTAQTVASVERLFHVGPQREVEALDPATVKIGERQLALDSPVPISVSVDADQASRHFPNFGAPDTHPTIRVRTRGPGVQAAVLSTSPVRISQVSTFANEAAMSVKVVLDDGTALEVSG